MVKIYTPPAATFLDPFIRVRLRVNADLDRHMSHGVEQGMRV
jgi:hypothetical protein